MRKVEAMIIVIIVFTSTLAGCTNNEEENIVQMEIISPLEGDWVEGQIQVSIATKMTVSEKIEVWIKDNYYSTEDLGENKNFNIDTSFFSYDSSSPISLNIELRHQSQSIAEVNVTALFPQRMTFWSSEDIQP